MTPKNITAQAWVVSRNDKPLPKNRRAKRAITINIQEGLYVYDPKTGRTTSPKGWSTEGDIEAWLYWHTPFSRDYQNVRKATFEDFMNAYDNEERTCKLEGDLWQALNPIRVLEDFLLEIPEDHEYAIELKEEIQMLTEEFMSIYR